MECVSVRKMTISQPLITASLLRRISALAVLIVGVFLLANNVYAAEPTSAEAAQSGQRLITIFDEGKKQVVLTNTNTVADTLKQAGVEIADHDIVEPSLKTRYSTTDFTVNIYRAKPMMVVDGMRRQMVLSPHVSARDIAKDAKLTIHDEDIVTLEHTDDLLASGIGSQVVIDRAAPITLVLYGKRSQVYTQAKTVGEMLNDKKISLQADDTLNVAKTTAIIPNMEVEIWRNGIQTITETQPVEFKTEQIQDPNQKIGYREVKTPGVKGEKNVTYEVMMKNGKEESRKEIQSVVTKQPQSEVVIVGSKPDFDGDFAAALAKLRSCEGGYNSWNPAGPYYGAYQFDQGTWASVSSAPYGNATPAEQDAAARALYVRRGWSPWPMCGRGLPDTFR